MFRCSFIKYKLPAGWKGAAGNILASSFLASDDKTMKANGMAKQEHHQQGVGKVGYKSAEL